MNSIERQLHRAMARLERLQAERRKLESAEPAPAEPKVMVAAAGNPPEPEPTQFVLSYHQGTPAEAPAQPLLHATAAA